MMQLPPGKQIIPICVPNATDSNDLAGATKPALRRDWITARPQRE
jgi:hypothetical protein